LKNNFKPEYEQFSQDFTQWSSHLVDYLVDAGGLSKDAAETMRASNPFYIPLKRSLLIRGIRCNRRGFVDLGSPIKKIKGSGREIVNPIESMIAMTEQIISVADKARYLVHWWTLPTSIRVPESGLKKYGTAKKDND